MRCTKHELNVYHIEELLVRKNLYLQESDQYRYMWHREMGVDEMPVSVMFPVKENNIEEWRVREV